MTLMTPWDTSTGRDVFRKLVRKVFDSTDREAVRQSQKLYKMLPTDKLFEREMRIAGLPSGTSMAEGGKVLIYEPKFGQTKDYEQTEYQEGFRVSWMFKKTNQWKLVERFTKNLSMKLDELKDVELAKLFNSPTATYTGYDGLHLAEAAHTCLDDAGTTFANLGSAAISLTALQNAEYYFDTLIDDQGAKMPVNPKGFVLYFHPYLKVYINELLRSTGRPFEISNTMNYWEGRFEPFSYVRLTSTTAWGLAAVGDDRYDIKCFTLAEPDVFVKDASDNTLDQIVLGHQSFGSGFGDGRGLYVGNV